MKLANDTTPSINDEFVSFSTSHDCATICIQVPISEISCPMKKSLKLRCRSARNAVSLPLQLSCAGTSPPASSASAASISGTVSMFPLRELVRLFHFDRADLIDRVTCRDPISLRLSPTWRVLCYRESNSASSMPADILARWISLRRRDRANRAQFSMAFLFRRAWNTRSAAPSCALRSRIAAATRFGSLLRSSKSRQASRPPHPRDSSSTDTSHGARRAVAM